MGGGGVCVHMGVNRSQSYCRCIVWKINPKPAPISPLRDPKLTHLLLIRGGDRRHMGGGGSILLGGLNRLGGGLGQGASTAVAVISWPSICPIEKRIKLQNM